MNKLKEFKIKVTSEQSKIVQETLFKEGYKWNYGGINVSHLDSPYLFIYIDKSLTCATNIFIFNNHYLPEITFEEFHKMFIYDISNVSMKDCIDKKDVSLYFKNIEDMKEALEYDDYICHFLFKKYYKAYNIYHAFEENCIGINCSECPFAKLNKNLLEEMLPLLKEEDMKNELKTPWCVRNDGSQLFKETVIKYLTEKCDCVFNDNIIINNYYYGITQGNNCRLSNECYAFGTKEIIYTIEEFMKLAGIKNLIINGEKEGLWEYYYSNGNLCSKGYYEEGKLDGLWEFYYNNGRLQAKGNYKNGEREGYWEFYDGTGSLCFKENYEIEVKYSEINKKKFTINDIEEAIAYAKHKNNGESSSIISEAKFRNKLGYDLTMINK